MPRALCVAAALRARAAKEVHNNATVIPYEDNPFLFSDLCFAVFCRVVGPELGNSFSYIGALFCYINTELNLICSGFFESLEVL